MRYVLCHFKHWSLKGSAASTTNKKHDVKIDFIIKQNGERAFSKLAGFTSLCKLNKYKIAAILHIMISLPREQGGDS